MLMARSGRIVLPIEGASAITATAPDSFGHDAFVPLAESYRRQIKAHCYRMTGSLHEAETSFRRHTFALGVPSKASRGVAR
jgi:RNA polymerase sigma-70 factor, ECF subfamily